VIRSTNNTVASHVLYDLQVVSDRLQATQRKLSTGKQINQVEDDPVGAGRALYLRSQVADLQQYQKNLSEAQGWLDASDSSLGAVADVVKRAKVLLTQGATDTVDQTGLNDIAAEISKMIDGARESMNATYAGRYLFSGTATLTQPYPTGSLTYAGDGNIVQRVIGQGELIDLNLRGTDAFNVPANATGQNVLQLLSQIQADLTSGNKAALGNGDMTAVDKMLDQLSSARAEVGARVNRLDTQTARLKDLELNTQDLLSKTEDADMAKTMVDYSMQQSVYQSALQSGARVVQPSLLDFLR
jgi:flagellar hook-associated protein 3 FlgL